MVGPWDAFRWFWPETRSLRGLWSLTLVLAAVTPALSAGAIWLFKVLVDEVVVPRNFDRFPVLALAYAALALTQGAVAFTDQYLSTWVAESFVLRLRTRLFDHLHRLSPGFFERRALGDVLSRLTGDIGAIEELVLSGVAEATTYVFQLAWFIGALFVLNWRLALASLVAAPGFVIVSRFFARRIKKVSREKRRRAGAIAAVAEESLANVALVRAYGRREDENTRFAVQNQASFTAQMTATRLQALFGPLTDLLEVAGVLLVIGLAVWELSNGRISIGGLLAFVAYLTQLYGPIQGAGQLMNSVYSASASAERVIELLDEAPAVADPHHPVRLSGIRGRVSFDNVSFRYPGAAEPALDEVSLTVAAGETVAIVGASGAGKSSLAKLLLRFDDPTSGSVTIDGVDLRHITAQDLSRGVAAVLQETLVFDGTVRENIRWGRPEATDDDIIAAARAADADTFIRQLPNGYDTRVGQRGRLLSGGQRQRLAIARAMIRDAPILLLDEPTTGLDAEATQRVLQPLRRLMTGRTTIIISHDLLTVADADRIVYLEHGRIAACGPHAQLLATSAGYARLHQLHHSESTHRPLHDDTPTHSLRPVAQLSARPVLELDRVGFAYPGQPPVLSAISATIEANQCLAVLGSPGSGKSTLLQLLAGQYPPSSGHLHLGGQPVHCQAVTLATPATEAITESIADHIRDGRKQVSVEEILAAARFVGAHETIMTMPDAYATRPLGTPLSPELVVRLALARALAAGPRLMLLDEPTAGLDRRARNNLLPILVALTVGRIAVITTRDPLVAALADHRVCLPPPAPNPTSDSHPFRAPRRVPW